MRGHIHGDATFAANIMKLIETSVQDVVQRNPQMTRSPKKWRVFLFLAAVIILFAARDQAPNELPLSVYEGKQAAKILESMPKKDRKRLEYFFKECISWDAVGYVLFGEKPMAFISYDKKLDPFKSFSSFLYAISPRRIQFKNGFKVWQKYEKFFPISRFVFLYEETESNVNCLFINKNIFLQKVQEHADDFKDILNRDVTGEELLNESLETPLLSEVLGSHDVLAGILFGFGRNNSHLFHRRSQLSEVERNTFCKEFNFGDPWEKEFEELSAKQEETSWISAYITGDHLNHLEQMALPGFYAILDDPETLIIKEQLMQTRHKIIEYYKDKDFLNATLQALVSDITLTNRSHGFTNQYAIK